MPPDVAVLLAEPMRALALEPEAAAALLGPVAALHALLAARVGQGATLTAPAASDRLLDAGAAAVKLGCAKDWVYRHARTLPFTVRLGGHLRFSEQGIERYIRHRRR
jgi:predicted DNA-binding transcriptional regulator AlpA